MGANQNIVGINVEYTSEANSSKMTHRIIFFWKVLFLTIVFFQSIPTALGIGISPGRMTRSIPEYHDSVVYQLWYSLIEPTTLQYSRFTTLGSQYGLNDIVTGWSSATGVTRVDDTTIIIDWSLVERNTRMGGLEGRATDAYVELTVPIDWTTPSGPGYSWIGHGGMHIEIPEPSPGIGGVAAVVTQYSFYQNFAAQCQLSTPIKSEYVIDEIVELDVLVSDFIGFQARAIDWGRFSYRVEWDQEGLGCDEASGLILYDSNGLGEGDNDMLSPGGLNGAFTVANSYDTPGDYIIAIAVSNDDDTTILNIPVTVVPEPVTMSLLGVCLGSLAFVHRRREN